MQKRIWFIYFSLISLLTVLLGAGSYNTVKQSDDEDLDSYRKVSGYVDENERCFKCHERADTANLKSLKLLTRLEYYSSSHRSLSCLGCHADPLPESPDRATKEAAASRTCTDCHLYIKDHQYFQFGAIEEEYLQSVHHNRKQSEFSCWKCHDPHKYKTSIRNTQNFPVAIDYNNAICLSCHINAGPYPDISDREISDELKTHTFLPEKEKHFGSVRCIDCHTKTNENFLIAHLVLPKENAVYKCSACHTPNSILLTTLYKQQYLEAEKQPGLFNSVVMKDIYIPGANRCEILNIICLVIFGFTFTGLLIHMIPRIITKPKT